MNIFFFSNVLVSITSLILIILLLIFGRKKLHGIWILCNFSILLWGAGTAIVAKSSNMSLVSASWLVALVGGYFIAVFYYHTVNVFTDNTNRRFLLLAYLFTTLSAIFTIFLKNTVVPNFIFMFNSFYYPVATISYTAIYFGWIQIIVVACYELLRFIKSESGIRLLQAKYILFAFTIGFVGGGSVLFPSWGLRLYPIGNFGVAIYAILVTYAILKYNIIDLKIAVTRVGVFIIVYSIILGIPFWIGLKYLGKGPWLLPTSICAILATVCPFVFILTQRRLENSLLQKERNSHKLLEEASYGMTTVKELQQILKLSVDLAIKILDFKKSSIFLFEEDIEQFALKASNPEGDEKVLIGCNDPLIKRLEKKKVPIIYDELKMNHDGEKESISKQILSLMDELSAKAIMPIMMKDRLLGILVLGDRDSNGIFTRELVGILTILCNQAALAIENASFIKERERDLDKQAQEQRFQMMGEMAVGISHQINNRFQSIIRSTELAITMYYMYQNKEREDLDLEAIAKRLVEGIEKANKYSQGGREVVDKILEFSKASFNATEIEFNETLQTAIELVKLKHSKFQYEIETDLLKAEFFSEIDLKPVA